MAERELLDAFDDCINRLAEGATIDECLRAYPRHAPRLRSMLETGLTVKRALPSRVEILSAQDRVETRLTRALQAPARRVNPWQRFASLAAALLLIVLVSGIGIAAQGSLPGDTLYGVKRLTENIAAVFSGTGVNQQFAQRRVDEAQQLLALQRPQEVTFQGDVEFMDGGVWIVAGLPLQVASGTPGSEAVHVGDHVEIEAYTTPRQELIATRVTLVVDNTLDIPVSPTLQISATIPAPTATPTLEATTSPTPTATLSPTVNPTGSPTTTRTESPTPSPTPTRTPQPITPTAAECVPRPPEGWVEYRVQAGDTLSGLTGSATLDEVMAVNCLTDARRIIVGQTLFLPEMPVRVQPTATPVVIENTPIQPADSGGSGSNSGSGSSSSGSSDNSDDDGNDNESSNDNDDEGNDNSSDDDNDD